MKPLWLAASKRSVHRRITIALFAGFFLVMAPPEIVGSLGDGLGREVSWCMRYACIAVVLLCYAFRGARSLFYFLAIAYGVFSFGTMGMSAAPFIWAVRIAFPCVATILLVGAFARDCYEELLWGAFVSTALLSLVNAFVLVVIPVGTPLIHDSVSYSFLGNRNGFSRIYLTSIIVSCLIDAHKKQQLSIRTALMVAAGIAQAVLAFSATSTVELGFVIVGLLLIRNRACRSYLNAAVYAVFYVVFFVALVVLRLQFLFEPLIQDLLGRRLDFSGRTDLWDQSLEAMDARHWLFGYPKGGTTVLWIGDEPFWTAHNGVLDILLWGGALSLVACVAMIGIVCVKLWESRDDYSASLYSLLIGAFFIGALMESIMFVQFVFALAMAYNVDTGNWRELTVLGANQSNDSGDRSMLRKPCGGKGLRVAEQRRAE